MVIGLSGAILLFIIIFEFFFLFNIWHFRRLQKRERTAQRIVEKAYMENIEKWRNYAVTCKKFKNGECDLSVPCDICTYYKEPKDEQEG